MTGSEYQKKAMRTNDGCNTYRLMTASLDADMGELLNGCLGLTGEAGEVSDLVKKAIFHEKEMSYEHLKKELGDVLWYIAVICETIGTTIDEVMDMNIEKLKKRYPEGFDITRANYREENDI